MIHIHKIIQDEKAMIDIIDPAEIFEYYKELEKNEKIKVVKYPNTGFNYSGIINYGVKDCDGDYVIQLNNDTELLTPNWLEIMLGFCQREDVGRSWSKIILSR